MLEAIDRAWPDGIVELSFDSEESYFWELYPKVSSLRARISDILEKYGIAVLPAEEWRKPAPSLHAGEDTLTGVEGKVIRVLDALRQSRGRGTADVPLASPGRSS